MYILGPLLLVCTIYMASFGSSLAWYGEVALQDLVWEDALGLGGRFWFGMPRSF